MVTTHEAAVRAALEVVRAERCKVGQHFECEHRAPVTSPFVRRALSRELPSADMTGRIYVAAR
jgi:hypothetical protein